MFYKLSLSTMSRLGIVRVWISLLVLFWPSMAEMKGKPSGYLRLCPRPLTSARTFLSLMDWEDSTKKTSPCCSNTSISFHLFLKNSCLNSIDIFKMNLYPIYFGCKSGSNHSSSTRSHGDFVLGYGTIYSFMELTLYFKWRLQFLNWQRKNFCS